MTIEQIVVGILFPLVLASFGYTFVTARGLHRRINNLINNELHDLKELELRITLLEKRR